MKMIAPPPNFDKNYREVGRINEFIHDKWEWEFVVDREYCQCDAAKLSVTSLKRLFKAECICFENSRMLNLWRWEQFKKGNPVKKPRNHHKTGYLPFWKRSPFLKLPHDTRYSQRAPDDLRRIPIKVIENHILPFLEDAGDVVSLMLTSRQFQAVCHATLVRRSQAVFGEYGTPMMAVVGTPDKVLRITKKKGCLEACNLRQEIHEYDTRAELDELAYIATQRNTRLETVNDFFRLEGTYPEIEFRLDNNPLDTDSPLEADNHDENPLKMTVSIADPKVNHVVTLLFPRIHTLILDYINMKTSDNFLFFFNSCNNIFDRFSDKNCKLAYDALLRCYTLETLQQTTVARPTKHDWVVFCFFCQLLKDGICDELEHKVNVNDMYGQFFREGLYENTLFPLEKSSNGGSYNSDRIFFIWTFDSSIGLYDISFKIAKSPQRHLKMLKTRTKVPNPKDFYGNFEVIL